ncbi:MAG: hypothetical protein EA401_13455 [Planctomycetota bacterium]|nr:MAG: hypothetical protein EA401_13455 [Planctomycetota bacterium]
MKYYPSIPLRAACACIPLLCVHMPLMWADETDPEAADSHHESLDSEDLPDTQGRNVVAPEDSALQQRRGSLAAARAQARAQRSGEDDVVVASDQGPWRFDGRLALGGGYDSNPQRRGRIIDSEADGEPVAKIDGLLRASWYGAHNRLSLAMSGSHDHVIDDSDAHTANLGGTASMRHLWQVGQQVGTLTGIVDSRRWMVGDDLVAWSHTAIGEVSLIQSRQVHTLSTRVMHVRYDGDRGDDGTGAWLGWRGWFLFADDQPLPRLEIRGRVGNWWADHSYVSVAGSAAFVWRSTPEPRLGTLDLEFGAGFEARRYDSDDLAIDGEAQLLLDAGVEAGIWVHPLLKVGTYTRGLISESDVEVYDYDRIEVGGMLIATF